MEHTTDQAQRFQAITAVIFSVLTGFLIVFPLIPSVSKNMSLPLMVAGTVAGFLVGMRRRQSKAFFYFVFVTALILLTVVSTSAFEIPTP
jgi:hypothetical protein